MMEFGQSPYDKCPGQIGRYHVVDSNGFIRSKTKFGFTAYDNAGNLSDREPGTFTVIDTADGSVYGTWNGGSEVDADTESEGWEGTDAQQPFLPYY